MTARLHVFLGQGGVGKTTLAASAAVALSARGRKVGLLGVDPAGRLRDALGMAALPEQPVRVPGVPGLTAAILRPNESLRRWAREELGAARGELFENPFFAALADRLAATTDALAAVRIAEWEERCAGLDELVVDTAPGANGLEPLGRPSQLLQLLDGRLLRWLGMAASAAVPDRMGRRTLRALSRMGGVAMVQDLGEFSLLIERLAAAMVRRLRRTRAWLRQPDTRLLVVCGTGAGAAPGARSIAAGLGRIGLLPHAVILNGVLPADAAYDDIPTEGLEPAAFWRFVSASLELQRRTKDDLGRTFPVACTKRVALDARFRLTSLQALGEALLGELQRLGPASMPRESAGTA